MQNVKEFALDFKTLRMRCAFVTSDRHVRSADRESDPGRCQELLEFVVPAVALPASNWPGLNDFARGFWLTISTCAQEMCRHPRSWRAVSSRAERTLDVMRFER